jgi:nitronate monooxygenase
MMDGVTIPSRLPIVQAPMAGGPSTPELAAAVNAAGGFGYVAAGYLSPESLTDVLDRTRALTNLPIGVNLFVPGSPDADDAAIAAYAARLAPEAERFSVELGQPRWEDDAYPAKRDVLTRVGVHTVSFTFGCPSEEDVRRLHAAAVRVAVTVTTADEAATAAAAGADSLIVQGTEAGGHQGTFANADANRIPLLDALAAVRARVDLPLVAAGGIMTADDAAAALGAGSVAVQLGTALLCTPEAGTSAPYRSALLDQRYDKTVITRAFSGRWARGLANRFAVDHPDAPRGYPQVHHLTRPLRAAAAKAGDSDVPNLWAGTGWRAITTEDAGTVVGRIASAL